jgi:hypothetical protein
LEKHHGGNWKQTFMHLARKKKLEHTSSKKIKNKDIVPSIKTVIISDASVAKRQRTKVEIRNFVNQEYNSSVTCLIILEILS